jgi:hypothetical protein
VEGASGIAADGGLAAFGNDGFGKAGNAAGAFFRFGFRFGWGSGLG